MTDDTFVALGRELGAITKDTVEAGLKAFSARMAELSEQLKAFEARVAAIKDGADGRDGANGADGANGLDGKDGRDGIDGQPGPRGDVGEKGDKGLQGDPGPQGAQGLPGRDGLPGVAGPQGEKGFDGKDGAPGKDGRDAVIENLKMVFDGERTVTFCFKDGTPIEGGVIRFPVVIDKGVYRSGVAYQRGDSVTFGGCAWIAQKDTSAKPGATSTDVEAWRLAVKAGRDGKDGKPGPEGPAGKNGRDGRDLM